MDYIDPAIGWPLGALLWAVFFVLIVAQHLRDRRKKELRYILSIEPEFRTHQEQERLLKAYKETNR